MLPFIVAGLVSGSVYGLAATGLVLTYKTSRVFNFAQGSLAAVSAFVFFTLHVENGMAWGWAALICLAVVGPVLGFVMELLARPLGDAPLVTQVASTVGVLVAVQAAILLIYGPAINRRVPQFLPEDRFEIGGTSITTAQVILLAVGVIATAALSAYFRWTRQGVATRAVVDDPDLLDLAGTAPTAVRRSSWVLGSVFASASGLLLAPLLGTLDSLTLTFLVVTAFGAAALGGFSSLPRTFLGALAIGVIQQLCTKYFTTGALTGVTVALPFIVLFAVMMVGRRSKVPTHVVTRKSSVRVGRWSVQAVLGLVVLVLLLTVPQFAGYRLSDWTNFLALSIMFLSLGLLVRTSGQVSLCHVSFLAIGACAMFGFTTTLDLPWLVALLLSGLVAVPVGVVLAVPAIRLSGLHLALATFGFGILLQYVFYTEDYMFGASALPVRVPRPELSWIDVSSDERFYYVALAVLVVSAISVVAITRSRLGRILRAVADTPVGTSVTGASPNSARILVFAISAFLASIAGAVQAANLFYGVTGDAYAPIQSLVFFAIVAITIGGAPWEALWAGAGFVLVPSYFPGTDTAAWMMLVFGLGAVVAGFVGSAAVRVQVPTWGSRNRGSLAARPVAVRPVDAVSDAADRQEPISVGSTPTPTRTGRRADIRRRAGAEALEVKDLTVRFGGLTAVDSVSLVARAGQVTGLIGPNGAGKTTTFNFCTGLQRPTSGRVLLGGVDVTGLSPAGRVRRGLGRTFQQMQLFDSMTVRQNVSLGAEGLLAGANVFRHLITLPKESREVRAAADEALDLCGLRAYEDYPVPLLSTGQRRLLDLARCLAGNPQIMLLDEPSSGLDRRETDQFDLLLREVVATRGVGVLIVEHDMSLVNSICDDIHVLDFGRMIFAGSTAEAMESPIVQAAYLGNTSDPGDPKQQDRILSGGTPA